MAVRTLASLHVYPIKSLAGISVREAVVQPRGLQYDRRWMLVDEQGRFVSQREVAEMALLGTAIEPPFLVVFSRKNPRHRIHLPLQPPVAEMSEIPVTIWDDRCTAGVHAPDVNGWFSDMLGSPLRLVYMPDTSSRPTDPAYVPEGMPVSFADGYPYLLIGQASLDDLNSRLQLPLPMNRFRPNFVIGGAVAYEEDAWRDFTIGNVGFRGVKPCARCIVTTTDQDTAVRAAEPLRTLATYRKQGHRTLFGQNVVWLGGTENVVRVGDKVVTNVQYFPGMLLFGPGIRHVPEHVWRSGFFWGALVLMIIGILLYHNYFKNMNIGNIFSQLFGSSAADGRGGAKIRYVNQGRSGYVWYESQEAKFSMYYELGGGDCVVGLSVPGREDWEKETGLPLERREEVLTFVGRQVVKDQTSSGIGSFKIEGNWLNIYA